MEGFICVGLNICVRRENKEGTDHIQYLVRIYVQDRKTGGHGPDAGCMT